MEVGTIVKIKEEYLNPGENPNQQYIVVEDKDSRCDISPYPCSLPLPPRNTVFTIMLEQV